MTRANLLRQIAEAGYNIGYAAKKHFATADLAAKAPGTISFLTFAVGVVFLLVDFSAKKWFSAACLILGVLGLRISMWDQKKAEYSDVGCKLTGLFNKAKALYFEVKDCPDADLNQHKESLVKLQDEFNSTGISNQMMFSDWYAHYKFFWQQQTDWIAESRPFGFFRDKIPLSLTATVVLLILAACAGVIYCYCGSGNPAK